MGYWINGTQLESDDEGYLLEACLDDEAARVIAATEGIELSDEHWQVIRYLRDSWREHGHTPNFRTLLKEMQAINPAADNKRLYDLFPLGPAKQGVRIAGLPKPYGKGGY
jgi:tRNA 2-thiouridine synthesizing protein E